MFSVLLLLSIIIFVVGDTKPDLAHKYDKKFQFSIDKDSQSRPGFPKPHDDIGFDLAPFNPCKGHEKVYCRNGGTCEADGHEPSCICAPDFLGRRCEYVADGKHCKEKTALNQTCKNGAICYSIAEDETVFGKIAAESDDSRSNVRRFQCWCKEGYFGDFCEYSNDMRTCMDEECNGRGLIDLKNWNGSCTCVCEHFYYGDKCQFVDPCINMVCEHGGSCKNGTCHCLETKEFTTATSTTLCRDVYWKDRNNPCFPCDSSTWINCKESWERARAHGIEVPDVDGHKGSVCKHDGNCTASVVFSPYNSSLAFYVPRCECGYYKKTHPTYGTFCEHKLHDVCSLTPAEEKELGRKTRCMHGGNCVPGGPQYKNCPSPKIPCCVCKPCYGGDLCEKHDPCYNCKNPCKGNSKCVLVPEHLGTYFTMGYSCLCAMGEEGTDCLVSHFSGCETSPCNDGVCLPCALLGDPDLVCVTDKEKQRGFVCICEPGVKGESCQGVAKPCDSMPCQNGGYCNDTGRKLRYECECLSGYAGDQCETIADICVMALAICQHGHCVEDQESRRGFKCECEESYYGHDCELQLSYTLSGIFHRYGFILWPVIFGVFATGYVSILICGAERRRRRVEAEKTRSESAVEMQPVQRPAAKPQAQPQTRPPPTPQPAQNQGKGGLLLPE